MVSAQDVRTEENAKSEKRKHIEWEKEQRRSKANDKKIAKLKRYDNIESITTYTVTFEGTLKNAITKKPIVNSPVELKLLYREKIGSTTDTNGNFSLKDTYTDTVYRGYPYHLSAIPIGWMANGYSTYQQFELGDSTHFTLRKMLNICPPAIDSIVLGITLKDFLDTLGLKYFPGATRVFYNRQQVTGYIVIQLPMGLPNKSDLIMPPLQLYIQLGTGTLVDTKYGPANVENFLSPFWEYISNKKITGTGIYLSDTNSRYLNITEKDRNAWIFKYY